MKKLVYLFFMILPLVMVSCSDDDETEERENIGTVVGAWGRQSLSQDVSSKYGTVINLALGVALNTYAAMYEPTYYGFYDDDTFEVYGADENGKTVVLSEGTYNLVGDVLTLQYANSVIAEKYEVIIANKSTLKIKKDYTGSFSEWGLGEVAESITGVSSASVTLTYTVLATE